MAKTYSELTQQIHQLQIQAEARRLSEAKGVIRSINEAIATYGLTAADLKFAPAAPSPMAAPRTVAAVAPKSTQPVVVKSGGRGYSDGAGNSWTGRGPRPKWLREALAAGNSLAKYEVPGSSKAPAPAPAPVKATSKDVVSTSASAKKVATPLLKNAQNAKKAQNVQKAKKSNSAHASTKAASALQASTAEAHVPVAAETKSDAGASIDTPSTVPATAERAPVPPQ